MKTGRDLAPLVGLIYDAALEPEKWPGFLRALAAGYPGGQGAMYQMQGARASVLLANWDISWTAAHNAHFYDTNPWLSGMRYRRAGITNAAEDFVPWRDFQNCEYYYDFLRPQGLGTGVGATILRGRNDMIGVSVLFDKGRNDGASPTDVDGLAQLVPHLQRAAKINRLVGTADFRQSAVEQVLDRLETGVIIADSGARVLYLNEAARRHAGQDKPLRIGSNSVLTIDVADQASRLKALVTATADMTPADQLRTGGSLFVRRGEDLLSLIVTPLRAVSDHFAYGRPAVAIFVIDPRQQAALAADVIGPVLNLTPMQARVAAALAAGARVKDIASSLGISEAAVRYHLKEAFARTGTRRQSDLVKLVATIGRGSPFA